MASSMPRIRQRRPARRSADYRRLTAKRGQVAASPSVGADRHSMTDADVRPRPRKNGSKLEAAAAWMTIVTLPIAAVALVYQVLSYRSQLDSLRQDQAATALQIRDLQIRNAQMNLAVKDLSARARDVAEQRSLALAQREALLRLARAIETMPSGP